MHLLKIKSSQRLNRLTWILPSLSSHASKWRLTLLIKVFVLSLRLLLDLPQILLKDEVEANDPTLEEEAAAVMLTKMKCFVIIARHLVIYNYKTIARPNTANQTGQNRLQKLKLPLHLQPILLLLLPWWQLHEDFEQPLKMNHSDNALPLQVSLSVIQFLIHHGLLILMQATIWQANLW